MDNITIHEVLKSLANESVSLYVDGENLVVEGNLQRLPDSTKEYLKENKKKIIEYMASLDFKGKIVPEKRIPGQRIPLSLSQQSIWTVDHLNGGSPEYNMPYPVRVKGDFNLAAAEQAINDIIGRHEVLRTVFLLDGDEPCQLVRDEFKFSIKIHRLDQVPERDGNLAISRIIQEEGSTPFNLGADLMIRASYVKLSSEDSSSDGILIFNMHHIASDGWSIGILVDEFISCYQARISSRPNPLPPLTIQYADFAIWQRKALLNKLYQSQENYWEKIIPHLPAVHAIPLDYPRPEVKKKEGEVVSILFPPNQTQELEKIARKMDVTVFMLVHAALSLVLARHGNTKEFVLGTSVANRRSIEVESLIGFFINTLVLRVSTDFEFFSDYLAHVKAVNLEAQENQDIPFGKLLDLCKVARSPQYSPLCQIVLTMNTTDVKELKLDGVEFKSLPDNYHVAKYDIEVSGQYKNDGIHFEWRYDKSIFSNKRIKRLSENVCCLLREIIKSPGARLSDLNILPESEKNLILSSVKNPVGQLSDYFSFHEMFERQAARRPDSHAICFNNSTITYRELNQAANRLAHRLIEEDIVPGSRVALPSQRCFEMMVGLLAILKAGGTYVPLDINSPKNRQAHIINSAGIELVLVWSGVSTASLTIAGVDLLQIDGCHQDRFGSYSDKNPVIAGIDQDTLAYILFTSGSTGMPKGVCVTHRNLYNYVNFCKNNLCKEHLDGSVVSTPLSFDATITSLLPPLVVGKCVNLLPEDQDELFEALLFHLLNSDKAWLFKLTPAHLQTLSAMVEDHPSVGTEHVVVIGGEILKPAMLAPWKNVFLPRTTFVNHYGPTETTVGCLTNTVEVIDEDKTAMSVPIGRPIDNINVYVLSSQRQLQPYGAIGELYIGGESVTAGYLNNEELTNQKFIKSPFVPGERLYQTGDMVRLLNNEKYECLGRVDDQVKINGLRIELGEIEFQLARMGTVSSSVVLAHENPEGKRQLVAHIKLGPNSEHEPSTAISNIKSDLYMQLPTYMVPEVYNIIDEWPMTPNGKIDKAALKSVTLREYEARYVPPKNHEEKVLVDIWQQLLRKGRIGVNDNFFELGGDSILSIQTIARAKKHGIHFTGTQLLKYQTISRLVPHVKSTSETEAKQEALEGHFRPLPIQKQFLRQNPDLFHYNQSVLLKVPVSLDTKILKTILLILLHRHDGMRLTFESGERAHFQSEPVALENFALESVSVAITKTLHEAFYAHMEKAQASLNFRTGPTSKLILFETNSGKYLFWVVHHLLVDGVSWRILLNDFQTILMQHANGQSFELEPKTTSIRQWSEYLHSMAESADLRREVEFWRKQIDLITPIASDNDQSSGGQPGQLTLSLSPELTEKLLLKAPAAYRVSINELLLASLCLAINRLNDTKRISVMLEGHGRSIRHDTMDLSQTVGWFTTKYPLTFVLDNAQGLGDLIICVKEQYRSVPGDGLGFGVLTELADAAEVGAARSDILFNYLGRVNQLTDHEGLELVVDHHTNDVDPGYVWDQVICFNGLILDDQLKFTMDFNQLAFDPSQAQKLVELFDSSLKEVADHCCDKSAGEYTPSDFPLADIKIEELRILGKQLDIEDMYVATGMQSGLLYHSQISPGSYINQLLINFENLKEKPFKQAWEAVVSRHDILRTLFVLTESGYQQIVTKSGLNWQTRDIRDLSKCDQENYIAEYCEKDKQKGYKLDSAPLMRLYLFRITDTSYRLLWSHHHVLWDGWCNGILMKEIIRYYQAFVEQAAPVMAAPARYRDYIEWLRNQDKQRAIDFWKQYLDDLRGATLFPRHSHGSLCAAKRYSVSLGEELTDRINEFCRASRCTFNTLVQGAWAYLLSRYIGESRVVFGTVVSGRPADLVGVEDMIGLFINTIPVIVDVPQDMEIANWLRDIHSRHGLADEHSYLPLHEIQQYSDISPLFDSLVVVENYPFDRETLESSDLCISLESTQTYEETSYGLTLIIQAGDQVTLNLDVQAGIYSESMVENVLPHLKSIFEEVIDPQCGNVKNVAMFSEEEKRFLCHSLNDTTVNYRSGLCLHQLFMESTTLRPDAVALHDELGSMTYKQLHEAAYGVQLKLRELDIKLEELVAVRLPKGRWQLIATLGIMMAGGAYLPLEVDWPNDRCDKIVQKAGCRYLLVLNDQAAFPGIHSIVLTESTRCALVDQINNITTTQSPENLAYVIFTSGSTGEPKGVAIEHRSVVNTILDINTQYGIRDSDKVLAVSSLSFDLSVYDLFGLLAAGGQIVFTHESKAKDPRHWLEMLEKHEVTLWNTVPVSASLLVDQLDHEQRKSTAPLRNVLMSGDWINPKLPKRLWQVFPGTSIYSLGGATEGSIWSIHYPILSDTDGKKSVPYGKPLSNQRFYVLNNYQQLMPFGAVGELCIAGVGVAREYFGDAELTGERFVMSETVSERVYRTGDQGRYMPDGNIEFIGRIDHQVKINGFRVETGEIEQKLSACANVESCLVTAKGDATEGRYLVAYVRINGKSPSQSDMDYVKEFREYLKSQLPDYMVPPYFVLMDSWPLTANGKVDLKSLPSSSHYIKSRTYSPPQSETELMLTEIWTGLLGVPGENIGIEDSFFEIGGHSLLLIKMLPAIEKHLNISLDLKTVYENNSIRLLAKSIDRAIKFRALNATTVETTALEMEEYSF